MINSFRTSATSICRRAGSNFFRSESDNMLLHIFCAQRDAAVTAPSACMRKKTPEKPDSQKTEKVHMWLGSLFDCVTFLKFNDAS